MSLNIPCKRILRVMIGNQWIVCHGQFNIDAYEFVYGDGYPDHPEDFCSFSQGSGVTYMGFSFETTDGHVVSGPMTAIQAVQWEPPSA